MMAEQSPTKKPETKPKVDMSEENKVPSFVRIKEFKKPGKVTGTGMAPHVVNVASVCCLAVRKLCSASSYVLNNKMPESVREHKVLIDSNDCTGVTRDLIDNLLQKLQLKQVYSISIKNELDYNGKIGHLSIYTAIWKSLSTFEQTESAQHGEKNIWQKEMFFRYLISKSGIDIENKNAVALAIFRGSKTDAFLFPIATTDNFVKRISSVDLWDSRDFLFVTTTRHKTWVPKRNAVLEERKSKRQHNRICEKLKEKGDQLSLEGDTIPKMMTTLSTIRVAEEESENLDRRTHVAIRSLQMDFPTIVEGLEVQEGGVLIMLRKTDSLNKKDFSKTIFSYFRTHVGRIETMTIDVLNPICGPFSFTCDPITPKLAKSTRKRKVTSEPKQ